MFSLRLLTRLGLSLAVFLLFSLHIFGIAELGLLKQLERYAYDFRLTATMPGKAPPCGHDNHPACVVIIDIDERSLQEQGQWPWSRDKVGLLVDKLFNNYGIRALGFDVVFAEADRNNAMDLLDTLQQGPMGQHEELHAHLETHRQHLQTDHRLAEVLAQNRVWMGYVFKEHHDEGEVSAGSIPPPVLSVEKLREEGIAVEFIEAKAFTGNLDELQAAASGGGFFSNPRVDADGVFRRVPVLERYGDGVYPSLAMAMALAALDEPPIKFKFANQRQDNVNLEAIWLGEGEAMRSIPVDAELAVHVPYFGGQGTFRYVSATDVLNDTADIEVLFDTIILVGTTAPGLLDLRATPVGKQYAGVEVHANLTAGILASRPSQPIFKRIPGGNQIIELLQLAIIGLVLGLLMPRLGPISQFALVTTIIIIQIGLSLYAWQESLYILSLATPLVYTLTVFITQVVYEYAIESRGKRRLSRMFGQYIPPELVGEIDASQQEISLEGEAREMSVLFSDVRGFTGISEGLNPQELTQLMNEFLTPITRVIHDNRGTIDKYMGDAVMAFWGAPLDDPEHARHSITAGLEMITALEQLQPEFSARGWPEIRIGVGVNTGTMNVGNMGSQFRMAYTVMGDAVNLGSRLEGITKQYGVQFIVSEFTASQAPEFSYRELDLVRVKGRAEPVRIFEPLGLTEELPESILNALSQFEDALVAYRNREWGSAKDQLRELLHSQTDGLSCMLYELYLERIAVYHDQPPEADWDGVFTHTSK